jgi:hypothetical protein
MTKGKGLVRAANRQDVASGKLAAPERATGRLAEPSVCDRCGAVFSGRTWRRRKVTAALLDRAAWVRCPACRQSAAGEYWGRVRIRGRFAAENEDAIRRRIGNVARNAQYTQPERRIVSAERDADVFEVLTTSQKLAHRIVRELTKMFRGRARYEWSDDGSLFAVWQRE